MDAGEFVVEVIVPAGPVARVSPGAVLGRMAAAVTGALRAGVEAQVRTFRVSGQQVTGGDGQ